MPRHRPRRTALMAALAAACLSAPSSAETIITITSAPLSSATAPAAPPEVPGLFTRLLIAIGLAPATSFRPIARPEAMAAGADRPAPVAANIATVIQNGQRVTRVTPGHRLPTGPDHTALLEAMPLPPEALARLR